MKLVISSSELLKAVMSVSKAIPSKTALPILENFLFVLEDRKLSVTASDSELTLKTTIDVDLADEEGKIAVPARQVMDLLKELPDQPLTIKTVSDSSFECSWTSGTSTMPYFPADDYPEISTVGEDAQKVVFPAQSLVEGISNTVYATADDEIRPIMNGILFDIDAGSTTLVASDAHKLICYTTTDVAAPEKCSFILHKKPANVLKSIIGKDTESVEVSFDAKNVVFGFAKTLVLCSLITGTSPQ
ncbi:MAG: DNA polymerase III subunit beta [Bacteroidales bacterium]|nr:DNA polymerase III subunit beta [Bacteroidales bacterium]